jgi:excisionase family DNA binding protein
MSKIPNVATPLTPHTNSISHTEPWVDLRTLAEHVGFSYQTTRRMVEDREIPGKAFQNGRKTFWRFQLSAVDAALTVPARER